MDILIGVTIILAVLTLLSSVYNGLKQCFDRESNRGIIIAIMAITIVGLPFNWISDFARTERIKNLEQRIKVLEEKQPVEKN